MKFTEILHKAPSGAENGKLRKRLSKKEREAMIKQWHASNLSRKSFCEQHALNVKTFSMWLGKIKRSPLGNEGAEATGGDVVEDVIDNEVHCHLELRLPNEVLITLRGSTPAALIVSIIKEASTCKFI